MFWAVIGKNAALKCGVGCCRCPVVVVAVVIVAVVVVAIVVVAIVVVVAAVVSRQVLGGRVFVGIQGRLSRGESGTDVLDRHHSMYHT